METLTMKATLPAEDTSNARNYGGEKETVSRYLVVGTINGKLTEVVDARFYMGRSKSSSRVYCALWVHGGGHWYSGKGTAGGYGYHKESAALEEAISSAGIKLHGANYSHTRDSEPDFTRRAHIGGCGNGSMETALQAIAIAAGSTGELLVIS